MAAAILACAVGHVVLFERIALQVVDLGRGAGSNRHPAAVGQCLQRTPSEQRAGYSVSLYRSRSDFSRTDASRSCPFISADGLAPVNRRIVGATSTRLTASSTCRRRLSRSGDDQRHAQGRVVEQHSVRALAVVAKPFSVIARDDDERAVHLAMRAQPLEHARDLFVRERDLAIVRRARPRGEPRRRRVRRVRIVEVNPDEEGCSVRGAWCLVRSWSVVAGPCRARRSRDRPPQTQDAPPQGVRSRSDLLRSGRRRCRSPARGRSGGRARMRRRRRRCGSRLPAAVWRSSDAPCSTRRHRCRGRRRAAATGRS